jgi:hypothetical protein
MRGKQAWAAQVTNVTGNFLQTDFCKTFVVEILRASLSDALRMTMLAFAGEDKTTLGYERGRYRG